MNRNAQIKEQNEKDILISQLKSQITVLNLNQKEYHMKY